MITGDSDDDDDDDAEAVVDSRRRRRRFVAEAKDVLPRGPPNGSGIAIVPSSST